MPTQTTKTGYASFPDGGKFQIDDGSGYFDVGAILGDVNFTLNFTENRVNTANAGYLRTQIREMTVDGGFTAINLEPEFIEKFGGGIIERVTTAGTTVAGADFTDQTIDGFTDGVPIALEAIVTADNEPIRFSDTPVITSVDGDTTTGLVAGDDYFIIKDSTSSSGYSIVLNSTGTKEVGTDETITVDFGDNDPIASETLYAGSSTELLTAYKVKIEHTDDDGAVDRSFELFAADPTSGGLQFGFKGADSDGVNELPVSFQGRVDTDRATGRQLFSYYTKG